MYYINKQTTAMKGGMAPMPAHGECNRMLQSIPCSFNFTMIFIHLEKKKETCTPPHLNEDPDPWLSLQQYQYWSDRKYPQHCLCNSTNTGLTKNIPSTAFAMVLILAWLTVAPFSFQGRSLNVSKLSINITVSDTIHVNTKTANWGRAYA